MFTTGPSPTPGGASPRRWPGSSPSTATPGRIVFIMHWRTSGFSPAAASRPAAAPGGDVSRFPLPQQAAQARGSRRIGLGITGLADALIMLGHVYGEPASLDFARDVMRVLCHTAYRTSIEIAREKHAFPFLDPAYKGLHDVPGQSRHRRSAVIGEGRHLVLQYREGGGLKDVIRDSGFGIGIRIFVTCRRSSLCGGSSRAGPRPPGP